ncbi:hypothetical protein L3X38_036896 [Prunus dulcis]|uniref:Uncharacterized protein n=1 Tax=Prunus dulcis TaxID=3755 RepID=A0AAD4V2C0_PRUDU|nr:hypothetical protein L3X38_036896 [Prunus dulcis]
MAPSFCMVFQDQLVWVQMVFVVMQWFKQLDDGSAAMAAAVAGDGGYSRFPFSFWCALREHGYLTSTFAMVW